MAVIGATQAGNKDIKIDVSKLVETRLLIQANSGAGKSYAIRKLLEETNGKVQQIVLDIEGEFATLRDQYDYILAGKGGDIPADPASAELLAVKTLELGVSLIVDLYELRAHERILFVKNFVEALVNSPKELWHPVMIVIDEAHVFVPEKGESVAASAIVDLASRGRKRGFCAVLATQRLSKLHKDVAAECLNKMIGRTSLDIDRKRAGDELGFLSVRDSLALRQLEPGQFYFFGPAISSEVLLGSIGQVKTSHPKAGRRIGPRQTAPTARIKAVLQKLADIPKEAEEERQDVATLKGRVRSLEGELRQARQQTKQVEVKVVDPKAIEAAQRKAKSEMAKLFHEELKRVVSDVGEKMRAYTPSAVQAPARTPSVVPAARAQAPYVQPAVVAPRKAVVKGERTMGACERKILGFLSVWPGKFFTRVQVGTMSGYSHGSGGFNNALSNLSQAGLIQRASNGSLALNTEADVAELIDPVPHTLQDWIRKLGACERAIYTRLLERPDADWPRDELAQATGYAPNSGGFNNSLSRLSSLGLLERQGPGRFRLNPEVASFIE